MFMTRLERYEYEAEQAAEAAANHTHALPVGRGGRVSAASIEERDR